MRKYLFILIATGILVGGVALAAPTTTPLRTIYPETTNLYEVGTSTRVWLSGTYRTLCLSLDSCINQWPTGGGGGGSGGGWATTTGANGDIIKSIFGGAVGINTTTPWATLAVSGKSGSTTPIFVIASSSNAVMFQIAANGALTETATSTLATTSITSLQLQNLTNQQVLYNNNGTVAGISTFSWDGTYLNVSNNTSMLFGGGSGNATALKTGTDGTFLFDTGSGQNIKFKGGDAAGTNYVQFGDFNTPSWKVDTLGRETLTGKLDVTSTTLTSTFSGLLTVVSTSTLASTTVTDLLDASLVSGNCVQAAAGGRLTTAAAACGSGGSGNSAWTIGLGLIYNATTTDEVIIGRTTTTTPATLTLQGSRIDSLLQINSSTGITLLRLNANGSLGLGTTTTAALFVVQGTSTQPTLPLARFASSTGIIALEITDRNNVNIPTTTASQLLGTDVNKNLISYGLGTTTATNDIFSINTTTANMILFNMPQNIVLNVASGTAGNNFNISTTTRGTGNALIINCPDSSASNRGCLTSADWTTFNNKGAALAGGTLDYLARWTSASALSVGKFIDNSTVGGYNATNATVSLLVQGTTTLNPFQVNTSTGISLLRVSTNGSVGIGTTTNGSILFVQGTSTLPTLTYLTIASSTGSVLLNLGPNGGLGFATTTDATTTAIFAGQYYSAEYDNGTATPGTIDWGRSNVQRWVLSGNGTFAFTNTKPGSRYLLFVYQDGTGTRIPDWPAAVHWSGGASTTLTTTAGKFDVVTFVCAFNGTCAAAANTNFAP